MKEDVESLKTRIAELEASQTHPNRIKNVLTEVNKDGILIIEVDLNIEFQKSKTGKTTIVASTGGFIPIPDWQEGFAFNLNIVKK